MDHPTLFDYLAAFDARTPPFPTLATASPLAGNSRASTPSSSKKKFRHGPRDSLNSRMKIGRPGSRRYRHWENEFFLLKNLSETESECESDDWDESYAPSYGAFAVVFEEGNRDIWEPFVDTTEEQQQLLLAEYESEDDSFEEPLSPLSSPEAFALLRKRSQRTLKRHKKSQLLSQMDGVIFAFTNGLLYDDQLEYLRRDETGETLIFSFSDKFQRHMLHALCEFYDLVSYSVDMIEERVTVVHARQSVSRSSSLMQYLNGFGDD